jgi:hypothetical protein
MVVPCILPAPARVARFDGAQGRATARAYAGRVQEFAREDSMYQTFVTGPAGTLGLGLVRRCTQCARSSGAAGCFGFGSGCLALAEAQACDVAELEHATRWSPRRFAGRQDPD